MNLKELAEQSFTTRQILRNPDLTDEKVATVLNEQFAWRGMNVSSHDVGLWRIRDTLMDAEKPLQASVSHGETRTDADPTLTKGKHDGGTERLTAAHTPRMLFLDVETRPNLMYVWNVHEPNYSKTGIVQPKELISFAASWEGEDDVSFFSVYHHGKPGMLAAIHTLLDEADIVVHYYGKRHDIPQINRDLILAGYTPPSPYKQLDIYDTIRNRFGFEYNGLGYVCDQLGIPSKLPSPLGFDNWTKLLAHDPEAWEAVGDYNRQDVIALKYLYYKLRPWIAGHPSYAAFADKHICPNCGGSQLQKRGFAYTQVSTFQRWQCQSCFAWSRTTKRQSGVQIRSVAD